MRLRRSMMFYPTLAEPVVECLVIGPIGVLSAHHLHFNNEVPWFVVLSVHIFLWFVSDIVLMKILHVSFTWRGMCTYVRYCIRVHVS